MSAGRRHPAPLWVLAITLLVTLVACVAVWMMVSARNEARFANAVEDAEDRIEGRLQTYLTMLRSTSGLFAASTGGVRLSEFKAFVESIGIPERYPGLEGIGFTAHVTPHTRDRFIASIRAQGLPEFELWPEHDAPHYFPVTYLEPLHSRNRAALGFDMYSEPVRQKAMERAWRTGEPAVSGKVTLKQEIESRKQPGFLIYLPVYETGPLPASEEDRLEALTGFVYLPFRVEDFFTGIFGQDVDPLVSFRLYEGTSARKEDLLHDSTPRGLEEHVPEHTKSTTLLVAGHAWTLQFQSLPLFEEATPRGLIPGMAAAGLAISLLLFGLMQTQVRARTRAEKSAADLRLAAEQTEAQRALLDAVLDAAPVGIIVSDANGKLVRMNPANRQLWGAAPYTQSIAEGAKWKGWWANGSERHGQLIQAREWALARAIGGEVVRGDVVEIEPFDAPGTRRTMLNSAAPVRNHAGKIIGAVVAQMDITARIHAEEKLRESEERFRMLADNMSQLAWMADETGNIVWYNRRWYEYTGTTFEDMQGRGSRIVHDPQEFEGVEARYRKAVANGQGWEDTFPLRRWDGEFRRHLSRAMPLRDAHGRIVRWFGTNTDVEDQLRQAEALREALQSRDIFLSVASHELKTPLTSLALRLGQLKRELQMAANNQPLPPRVARNLQFAEEQLRRLGVLVDGLLDVTRMTESRFALSLEDLDFADVVHETVQAMSFQAQQAGTPLQLDVLQAAVGRFDRMRLGQVVTNLLSNAIKFGQGRPIRVSVGSHEGWARLTVRDEGIGISPENLERIFHRFERGVSERHYGGLGLGLYVTRQIVQAMGGNVRVESTPGQGTTFTVELPLHREDADEVTAPSHS